MVENVERRERRNGMSIELWAARLERPLTDRETAAMLRLLPEERRQRLERLKALSEQTRTGPEKVRERTR